MKRTPTAPVAAALKRLPSGVKLALAAQCDGDWARVTVENGQFVVHNRPQVEASRSISRPPTPKAPPAPKAPAAPPARPAQPAPPARPAAPAPSAVKEDWDSGESPEMTAAVTEFAAAARAPRPRRVAVPVPSCQRCGHAGHFAEECRTPASRWLAQVRLPEPSARRRSKPVTPEVEPAPESTVELEVAQPAPAPVNDRDGSYWARMHSRREQEAREHVNKPVALPTTAKGKLRTRVELEALAALIGSEAPKPTPGVNIMTMSETERAERARQLADKREELPARAERPEGYVDPLEVTCMQALQLYAQGIPDHLSVGLKPDVEVLYGLDKAGIEGALRHPQRVTIRPESYDKVKRYPVLAFYRGDVEAVVGFRFPTSPAVIAAYMHNRLEHDTHRVNHMGGGGRKRDEAGLPKTPKQVISRLAGMGAVVAEPGPADKAVAVKYKGQDLGNISVGSIVPRATCESDYQRTIRKMHAIDRREAAVSS